MSAQDLADRIGRVTQDLREINERRAADATKGRWLIAFFALITLAVGAWRFL